MTTAHWLLLAAAAVAAVLWLWWTRRRPRLRGVDAELVRAEPSAEEPRYSGRGFVHFDPIEGRYGGSVEVYESSASSAPCMWVGIVPPPSGIGPKVHLHLDDAARLRDQLTYLIEHHYQLEAER